MKSSLVPSGALSSAMLCALGGLGCSDDVPPAAEGAFYLSVIGDATDSKPCCTATHQRQVGEPGLSGSQRVLEKDGVNGAAVDCLVRGDSSFEIEATVEKGNLRLTVKVPAMTASATKDKPVKGSVEFFTDKIGEAYASPPDTPCDFFLKGGTQQQISAGVALLSFTCTQVQNNEGLGDVMSKGCPGPSSCRLEGDGASTIAVQKCIEE
jgi:hypothetical protein